MKIAIIGAGEIGSAISVLIQKNPSHTLALWDKNASKLPKQSTLQQTIKEAEVIFLCIPSWTLRGALLNMHSCIESGSGIICLSKGLENETCKTTDALLRELLPANNWGMLGGPMIAKELIANKPTIGVIGTEYSTLAKKTEQIFKNSALSIKHSKDTRGVAICGVLKNVYTLAIGICSGLELGQNATGSLITTIVKEMSLVAKKMGAKNSTVLGPAGLGDLYATSHSPSSHNLRTGISLAMGTGENIASEGLMSLSCFEKILKDDLSSFPVLNFIIEVGKNNTSPKNIIKFIS